MCDTSTVSLRAAEMPGRCAHTRTHGRVRAAKEVGPVQINLRSLRDGDNRTWREDSRQLGTLEQTRSSAGRPDLLVPEQTATRGGGRIGIRFTPLVRPRGIRKETGRASQP